MFKITKFMRDSIMNDDMYLYYLESLSYDYTGKIDKALDSIIK